MVFEISVFLENKIEHFEKITRLLRETEINIRSLLLNNIHHGWGVLHLLVDDPQKAYNVLSEAGNSVSMREMIALGMKDESGGLDELLIHISKAGIHIESAYSRVIEADKKAILLLEVPDVRDANQRLNAIGVNPLNDSVVYGK
ncbi:MAG: acetolactate synthase [Draconibacterium sp.]|nr:MAG: acetolactate synthase [Draconibacterium sp.]